ncbi:MAG: hypothetical protein WAV09_04595 [Minisyncoccia bacterium]
MIEWTHEQPVDVFLYKDVLTYRGGYESWVSQQPRLKKLPDAFGDFLFKTGWRIRGGFEMCEPISREEKRHVIAQRTAELAAVQRDAASRKAASQLQPGDKVMDDAELFRMVTAGESTGGSYL